MGGVDPRLHHGTLNAVFLPLVVEFNSVAETMLAENKLMRMAQAMNLGAGETVVDALKSMNERLGMPKGLAEMGVTASQFDQIIAGAMKDHCHGTNPRVATEQEYRALLEQAL